MTPPHTPEPAATPAPEGTASTSVAPHPPPLPAQRRAPSSDVVPGTQGALESAAASRTGPSSPPGAATASAAASNAPATASNAAATVSNAAAAGSNAAAEPASASPETAKPPSAVPKTAPALAILAGAARAAAPAIALYLALRLAGIAILTLALDRPLRPLLARLGERFDSTWYVRIAEHGYTGGIPVPGHPTDLAFFPLYPALIATLDPVVPGRPWTAALAIAWLSGIAAAWALFALGRHLRDARTGIALAALWAVLPHALVESMAYTEGLFTALAAWALYAVLRRRWLTAGVLTLIAGTSRPTAAALVVAVAAAAALAHRQGWRPRVALVVAPLGLLAYATFVSIRTGQWDGYRQVQRVSWGLAFDGGGSTTTVIRGLLTKPAAPATYMTAAVLVVAAILLVLLAVERWPAPLLVYGIVVFVMAAGTAGYFYSKGRLLLPDYPLLLPVAAALAAARPARAVAVLVTLSALSGWFGTYLSLVWRYSP